MGMESFIGAGASLLGGAMQGNSAANAARASADAQVKAAQIAADAARFRPVGITTRYGTSNFQTDASGNLIGAGYTVSPELRAYQDRILGLTERGIGQAEVGEARLRPNIGAAESLFSLGSQYLEQTPEQTAQKYIESQYNLLAPSRERSLAGLRNQEFQRGRLGLSVGATGERPSGGLGLSATNPEMEAYYNALAQQDLQIAQQAEQAGQQRTAFGTGLFSTGNQLLNQYYAGQVGALNPFTTYLGGGQAIEQMGQQPLTLGAGLGGQAAAYGANAGRDLLTGGMSAALTQQQANAYNPFAETLQNLGGKPQFGQGVANWWQNRPQQYNPTWGQTTNMGTQQYSPQQFQQQQASVFGGGNAGFD